MSHPTEKTKAFMQTTSKWCLVHIKGLGALIGGIFLMYFFKNVIIYFAMFAIGAFLTYYGFVELNVTPITNFVENTIKKLKYLYWKK